ncbi:gp16 family protein [Sphingomonas sp. SRS2]|uniref:gp16 family protein n=1 Tax=Sphingomonas sp. SRS2 TaxID=133190 RepID=UPI0006983380|nr:regulatory protein GemA [Sphingomonas sp. SRS2]
MAKIRSHNTSVAPDRRALLGKVHLASKALGLDDDDYRAVLERITGKRSAGQCDAGQLVAIVAEFERLGFRSQVRATTRPGPASHPIARKARAMWISLHQLGAINDPSERALEAFCKRQVGVDRLHWANHAQGFRLIEALKAMAERHGWHQDVPSGLSAAERTELLKDRLADLLARRRAAL